MLRQQGWHLGRLLRVCVSGHDSGVSADELHSARMNVRQYVLREIIQTTRLWTPSYHWWCRNLGVHSSLKTMTKNVTWALIPVKCSVFSWSLIEIEPKALPILALETKQTKTQHSVTPGCINALICSSLFMTRNGPGQDPD